jgi:hypothetical protein
MRLKQLKARILPLWLWKLVDAGCREWYWPEDITNYPIEVRWNGWHWTAKLVIYRTKHWYEGVGSNPSYAIQSCWDMYQRDLATHETERLARET